MVFTQTVLMTTWHYLHFNSLVSLKLNQIYSKEEKYVLLEVETPAGEVGNQQALATISVNYDNLITAQKDLEQDIVTSRFVSTQEEMDLAVNDEVLLAAVTQIATETNRQAVTLRDEGKVQEAKALLDQNVDYLGTFNKRFGANAGFGQVNGINLIGRNLVSDDAKWNAQRKNMRAQQNYLNSSQTAEWPQEIQDQIDAELPSYWDTNNWVKDTLEPPQATQALPVIPQAVPVPSAPVLTGPPAPAQIPATAAPVEPTKKK